MYSDTIVGHYLRTYARIGMLHCQAAAVRGVCAVLTPLLGGAIAWGQVIAEVSIARELDVLRGGLRGGGWF